MFLSPFSVYLFFVSTSAFGKSFLLARQNSWCQKKRIKYCTAFEQHPHPLILFHSCVGWVGYASRKTQVQLFAAIWISETAQEKIKIMLLQKARILFVLEKCAEKVTNQNFKTIQKCVRYSNLFPKIVIKHKLRSDQSAHAHCWTIWNRNRNNNNNKKIKKEKEKETSRKYKYAVKNFNFISVETSR